MKQDDFPDEVGIMVLPNALLFPQALLPLYIFEPRYRDMLKLALSGERMFAVANGMAGDVPKSVAGIGLIRACVDQPDGTSNLVLQGVSRVRFAEFTQMEPYFRARVELLPTEATDDGEVKKLGNELRQHISGLQVEAEGKTAEMLEFLCDVEDNDALADIISYSMVQDVAKKQELLEAIRLPDRLRLLLDEIRSNGINGTNFYFG